MKFAIVAALMAAVSGTTATGCATVKFHVWKDKDCSTTAGTTIEDDFNHKLVGADETKLAGGACLDKTFSGKTYYYKASCPGLAEAEKRIMTIQLYSDDHCTKKIDKASCPGLAEAEKRIMTIQLY